MKKSFYINILRAWCTVMCLALLGSMLCLCIRAQAVRDYTATVDEPTSTSATNTPVVIRNMTHGTDPVLKISGWIRTDQTMKAYEYTMDGGKTWNRSTKAVVSRPDVQKYCPDTYETAGFHLEIDVSELPRGTYDLFLRGFTENGDVIDVLAMLDMSIGHTDTQTMAYRQINLAAYGADNGTLSLEAGKALSLGKYNLNEYVFAELILDRDVSLTIRNSDSSVLSFTAVSDTAVQNDDGSYTVKIPLHNVQYASDILLISAGQVNVRQIRLYTPVPDYYTGELTVHMTATPYEFLSGANTTDALLMADDTVGTYMRLFPTTDTNDPYIYFNLGKYLDQTAGRQINADHYRYAVITLQTPDTNSQGHFRLFLCAGDIRGPSPDSHIAFTATNDGKWHTYIVPLHEEEHWTGTIYGMRFDYIDSHAKTTDYANIASIGFYPDEQSAKAAAAQPLSVYHEDGKAPESQYKEEGRAPSGKADAITWFDQSLSDCFIAPNKTNVSFDEYGHLMLQATENFSDPFVSFDLQQYAAVTGLPTLHTNDYRVIVLRVMADEKIQGKGFVMYYYAGGHGYASESRTAGATYQGGDWEYLIYDLSADTEWTDQILGMRLDYSNQISAGQRVCIADMLFFKDMDAWEAYAAENGIDHGDNTSSSAPEINTFPPETEMPTIEIPTQGPGLEYIPPEQQKHDQNTAGCQSTLCISLSLILPLSAVALIKNKTKKGDQS